MFALVSISISSHALETQDLKETKCWMNVYPTGSSEWDFRFVLFSLLVELSPSVPKYVLWVIIFSCQIEPGTEVGEARETERVSSIRNGGSERMDESLTHSQYENLISWFIHSPFTFIILLFYVSSQFIPDSFSNFHQVLQFNLRNEYYVIRLGEWNYTKQKGHVWENDLCCL